MEQEFVIPSINTDFYTRVVIKHQGALVNLEIYQYEYKGQKDPEPITGTIDEVWGFLPCSCYIDNHVKSENSVPKGVFKEIIIEDIRLGILFSPPTEKPRVISNEEFQEIQSIIV